MKKLLLLLLCLPLIGIGQNVYIHEDNWYTFGGEGSYQYLISDNVNIRLSPSTNTPIVANLPIASRLKIIEVTSDKYTYNNIISPWCKVSFILDEKKKIGYVPGIYLADKYHISSSENLVFLSGISKYYYKSGIVVDQIRVAKNNKELDRIDFFGARTITEGGDYLSLLIRKNKELNKDINIIEISYSGETCADYSNNITFFFDNNKLYHIRTFSDFDNKYLRFNNEKIQVIKNNYLDCTNITESGSGCGEVGCCLIEEIIKEYIWDGRMLQRIDAYSR